MQATEAVDRREVQKALEALVRDSVGVASGLVALLLAFFVALDPLLHPPDLLPRIIAFDAALALLFGVAWIAFRRGVVPADRADAVGGILALATVANVLHDARYLADPEQATYLMPVVFGAGSLLLSARWLAAVVAASMGGWLALATTTPGAWLTIGLVLLASCVVAAIVQLVRIRAYEGIERLRLLDARRKDELARSEERYRNLVERSPDAFLLHCDGRVVYVNNAGVALFGARTPEDLLGRDALSLAHPDHRETVRARIGAIEQGRVTTPMEMRILRLDGSTLEVEVIGLPATHEGRPADQTILRDISDRKRAHAERAVAAKRLDEIERLREMDRVRTQFVNTISHELRTPLTPIKVQLHLLRKATPGTEQHERATAVLARNFDRLNALVDELLEVAKIQAGTLTIARSYVPLDEPLRAAIESYADVAKQGGVDLQVRLAPGAVVLGDPKRLTQVMFNLLGNAFKFTPPGGAIHVDARVVDGAAEVRVRDTGAGIAPEHIERLFEPFSQVHDTMEQTHAGTGLGLFISRGIIVGHGGRIWAESEGKGKGTTFAFTIPLAKPIAPARA